MFTFELMLGASAQTMQICGNRVWIV